MLEYDVVAKRIDAHGSTARCKDAEIVLDTDVSGRPDAFNPAELFLAAIAACMIKGIRACRADEPFQISQRGGPPTRCAPGQSAIHVLRNL